MFCLRDFCIMVFKYRACISPIIVMWSELPIGGSDVMFVTESRLFVRIKSKIRSLRVGFVIS